MEHISPQSGVVLHRASDLFDGRKYYRQIRKYIFDPSSTKEIVSAKSIGDIEFSEVKMDFQVDTSGYLEMDGNHNLRTAESLIFRMILPSAIIRESIETNLFSV